MRIGQNYQNIVYIKEDSKIKNKFCYLLILLFSLKVVIQILIEPKVLMAQLKELMLFKKIEDKFAYLKNIKIKF